MVHRSSTENFRNPTLQVAVYSTPQRHWDLPAAYPGDTQQHYRQQPQARVHDDVDADADAAVAVHSRVAPTRVHVHVRVHAPAHVAQHLAFHCVLVRCSPWPLGQRASSGEGERTLGEEHQPNASPKAVF